MQLDMFSVHETEIEEDTLTNKANELLILLNEGRKKKEYYEPQWTLQHHDLVVLIASTKDKDAVGNIIDIDGNTPDGFPVNWRNLSIIRQELDNYKPR